MSNSAEIRVVGFLDDDDRLPGQVLNGLPIYNPVDLEEILTGSLIADVLLALPMRRLCGSLKADIAEVLSLLACVSPVNVSAGLRRATLTFGS